MSGSLAPFQGDSGFLVLDSWPIMEWLKAREPAATLFDETIERAKAGHVILLLSTINLGEVLYNCWNVWGEDRAEEIQASFRALPIMIVHPTEEDVRSAARIKGRYKISYADSFTAILAVDCAAPVLTGDPDFLKLLQNGVLAVDWIGA